VRKIKKWDKAIFCGEEIVIDMVIDIQELDRVFWHEEALQMKINRDKIFWQDTESFIYKPTWELKKILWEYAYGCTDKDFFTLL